MWFLLLACAHAPCEGLAPGAPRDRCLARRITAEGAALPIDEVTRLSRTIEDPRLRSEAVRTWTSTRHGPVLDEERDALCATLDAPDRPTCLHRLTR